MTPSQRLPPLADRTDEDIRLPPAQRRASALRGQRGHRFAKFGGAPRPYIAGQRILLGRQRTTRTGVPKHNETSPLLTPTTVTPVFTGTAGTAPINE